MSKPFCKILIDGLLAYRQLVRIIRIANMILGGVDVGLTNWITSSNGQVINRPNFLNKSIHKIKTIQQNLSRKKKGSKNRWKTKLQLAKAWRHQPLKLL